MRPAEAGSLRRSLGPHLLTVEQALPQPPGQPPEARALGVRPAVARLAPRGRDLQHLCEREHAAKGHLVLRIAVLALEVPLGLPLLRRGGVAILALCAACA